MNMRKNMHLFTKLIISTGIICIYSGLILSSLAIGADHKAVIITKGVWSTGVGDNKEPSDELSDIVSDAEQLYFYTLVQGNKNALKILETQGKLPLRHKWYHYYGATPNPEGSQTPTDAINLNIGKVQILSKLKAEVSNSGHFNWRTWSMKQNISPGLWVIRIVYADGSSVYCKDIDAPCEYKILIK